MVFLIINHIRLLKMKNFIYPLAVGFILILSSCEKPDLSNETEIQLGIDKENVEPPGGQGDKSGSTTGEGFFEKIDKENVEPPGGQGGN